MDNRMDFIGELINSCFLPALTADYDATPLEAEHFAEYTQFLKTQLPVLFDFLNEYKEWFFNDGAVELMEIRSRLLFLLCEIEGLNRFHRLFDCAVVIQTTVVLTNHYKQMDAYDDYALQFYADKMRQIVWKRNWGSVHGLHTYTEYRYNILKPVPNSDMNMLTMSFCLSAGLKLHDELDYEIRKIGCHLFLVLLESGDPTKIVQADMHGVISNEMMPFCMQFTNGSELQLKWSVLSKCMQFDAKVNAAHKYFKVNSFMAELLDKFFVVTDADISLQLVDFVIQLGYQFSSNANDIRVALNTDFQFSDMSNIRAICQCNDSKIPLYWFKGILQLLLSLAPQLLSHNQMHVWKVLKAIHGVFLVYAYHIPLKVTESLLMPFFEKFMKFMMKVLAVNKEVASIQLAVKRLLQTFYQQQVVATTYSEYKGAFEKLLEMPMLADLP